MSASLGRSPSLQLHTVVGIVLWGAIELLALARARWKHRNVAPQVPVAPPSPMPGTNGERASQ
jgi:cytochrome b561